MPYTAGYTDYPVSSPRPDINGQVTWVQALLIQNYAADKYLVIDKEVKGGLHRVKYRSQLYNSNYDGIFNSRRMKGMLVHVELEDDDSLCGKYYSLQSLPGTLSTDWKEIGAGSPVTLNNPKTVANLPARDALSPAANDFVNVVDARTPAEITANAPVYPASFIWSGTAWLQIYPYGQDPRAHAQNTDTAFKLSDGSAITFDNLWYTMLDPRYRKRYNDAVSIEDAIDQGDNGGLDVDGQGREAWTSYRIAQELIKRPACLIDGSGDSSLFLDQTGNWSTPLGGNGTGTPIKNGDIMGGGGADPNYFL